MSVNTYLNNNLVNVAKATQVQLSPSDQVSFMPTAAAANEGYIYQYIGTSTEDYINGYFYKCVSDGAATPAYSWQPISTQPTQAAAATPYTDTDGYLNADNVQDALYNLAALIEPQEWRPLNDGYTNLWIRLDKNDELTQEIRFATIPSGATINWGDGDGNESLTESDVSTVLTHTYDRVGPYLIKIYGSVKLNSYCLVNPVLQISDNLLGVELADNVTISESVFGSQSNLKFISLNSTLTSLPQYFASYSGITTLVLPDNILTIGANAFYQCKNLYSITLGNAVTRISNYAFQYDSRLLSVIINTTTPPTLGASVFASINSEGLIYVPVGTLTDYKTAWSTYESRIVEQSSS